MSPLFFCPLSRVEEGGFVEADRTCFEMKKTEAGRRGKVD